MALACRGKDAGIQQQERFAVVLTPVGDDSRHDAWLASAAAVGGRNWDIVALYFGHAHATDYQCQECVAVQRLNGAKWRLVSAFLNSTTWNGTGGRRRGLSRRYKYVMIADDDLDLTADILNRFFVIVRSFNLTIAQPSVCK